MRRGVVDPDADHKLHRDLARRLNAQDVLDHYDVENAYEQNTEDGTTEVIHSCLIDRVEPHHANGDQNPSASCNIDKGLYVCYGYTDPETGKSGMDMVTLVMKLEGKKEVRDVLDVLSPHLSGATADDEKFTDELDRLLGSSSRSLRRPPPRTYSVRVLESWAYVHPYLATRGIDDGTASELQIGYDPEVNRITIPHFWRGALVGWQKRAIPAGPDWPETVPAVPKYKNSPGFPKSTTLYRAPLPGECETVCVVESPFSTIRSVALLCGVPVVATFGAKITDEQVALLSDYENVVVWMDADEAGASAERKLVAGLHRHTNVSVVTPDEGVDLADYDDVDAVYRKIDDAVPALIKMMEWDNG